MTRPKGYMDRTTFIRCLEVLDTLDQTTVGIQHYGESMLHPDFIDFVDTMVDWGIRPRLHTNGDFVTERMYDTLRKMDVVISGHMKPEECRTMAHALRAEGINAFWQSSVADGAISIANQVRTDDLPFLENPATQCNYITQDVAIVLWNGDLVPCCMCYDSTQQNGEVFGNIHDLCCYDLTTPVIPLCSQCPGHPNGFIPNKEPSCP